MGKIYNQMSIEERVVIQIRLEMGVKPGAIALKSTTKNNQPFRGGAFASKFASSSLVIKASVSP